MEKYSKSYKFISLLVSIIFVCFSVFMIIQPAMSISVLIKSLGVIVLVDGILHIASYFKHLKGEKTLSLELIRGILNFIIGVIVISNPEAFLSFFAIIIGVWILIQSIIKFQFAFNMKSIEDKNWIIIFILAIVTFLFGCVILFNPLGFAKDMTIIYGIILLITEIINIIEIILFMLSNK